MSRWDWVIGRAVWPVAETMSYLVYLVAALGCPLAVGLLMWLLTGGPGRAAPSAPTDSEIAELCADLARARVADGQHPSLSQGMSSGSPRATVPQTADATDDLTRCYYSR